MHRTLLRSLSKRITIPKLSPTHSKVQIQQILIPHNNYINEYEPIMIVKCSPDVVTKGFRESENHMPIMIIDSQEEGIVEWKSEKITENVWLDAGTVIGKIDDGEEVDGDWI